MQRDNDYQGLIWTIDRLLVLLSEIAVSGKDPGRTSRFRTDLSGFRRRFTEHSAGESLDPVARKCVALCQDYFQYFAAAHSRNEKEYGLIIDLLRQAIATLTSGASLHSAVLGSTQRFKELAKLDDLQELRKRIADEVIDLEREVRSKQLESERFTASLVERLEFIECKLSDTENKLKKSETETSIDPLTGISNRRHFDRQLDRWTNAQHRVGPFVLAMVDVDNFKKVNDHYGHRAGDIVLAGVANTMRKAIRSNDVLARYGGEEFAILFWNMTLEMAEERCQRILAIVRAAEFEIGSPDDRLSITLSCGLAAHERGDNSETLMQRADDALYSAKQHGRNRIELRRKQSLSLFKTTSPEAQERG